MNTKLVESISMFLHEQTTGSSELSAETIGGCTAFAKAYAEYVAPLPVDPVAMLVAYERYQDQLAAEAVSIDWLPDDMGAEVSTLVADAIDASEGIIGCEKKEAADSLALWLRGLCNLWAAIER